MDLNRKICIVTGAGSSVGKSIVDTLISKNATIVAILHGETSVLNEVTPNHFTIHGELIDRESVQTIVDAIVSRYKVIHVLVNAVGGFHRGESIEESSSEQWKNMLSVNFITTLNCCQIVLPIMKKEKFGRIINFGSFPGEKGMALAAPYAVSKAAVHILTKTIVQEGRDYNILAQAVLPNTIDTPQNRAALPDEDWSRWVKPSEVANTIVSILEENSEQTGESDDTILIPLEHVKEEKEEAGLLSAFDQLTEKKKAEETPAAEEPIPVETMDSEQPSTKQAPKPGLEESPVALENDTIPETEAPKIDVQKTIDKPAEPKAAQDTDIPVADAEPEPEGPTPSANMATFTLFGVLKKQGLYRQALDVLKVLEEKGDNPERIQKEKQELEDLIREEANHEEETESEPAATEDTEDSSGKLAEESAILKPSTVQEESRAIDPAMASLSMVNHLKMRGLYQDALEMLEVLSNKGGDEQQIRAEQEDIQSILQQEDFEGEEEEKQIEDSVIEQTDERISDEPEDADQIGILTRTPKTAKELFKEESTGKAPAAEEPIPEEAAPEETSVVEKEEIIPEIPVVPVSPPVTANRFAFRPPIWVLAGITIVVIVFVLWSWVALEGPFFKWLFPDGQSNTPSNELALSQVTFSPIPPPTEIPAVDSAIQEERIPIVIPIDSSSADSIREMPEAVGIDTLIPPQMTKLTSPVKEEAVDEPGEIYTEPEEETPLEDSEIDYEPEDIGIDTTRPDTVIYHTKRESSPPQPVHDTLFAVPKLARKDTTVPSAAISDTIFFRKSVIDSTESPDPVLLFQSKGYVSAAQYWRQAKKDSPERYTIVLEYACANQTILNAYGIIPRQEDFFLLPYKLLNRDCFIFCWGDFPDRTSAEERLREVPSWFEENDARPAIRSFAQLIKE